MSDALMTWQHNIMLMIGPDLAPKALEELTVFVSRLLLGEFVAHFHYGKNYQEPTQHLISLKNYQALCGGRVADARGGPDVGAPYWRLDRAPIDDAPWCSRCLIDAYCEVTPHP